MDFPGVIREIIYSYLHKCERNYIKGNELKSYAHLSLKQVMTIENKDRNEWIRWCGINDDTSPIQDWKCDEEDLRCMVNIACSKGSYSIRLMEFIDNYITNLPSEEFFRMELTRIYNTRFIQTQEAYLWFETHGFINDEFDVETCILENDDVQWLISQGFDKDPGFSFETAIEYAAVDCLMQVIQAGVVAIPENLMAKCVVDEAWTIRNLEQIYTQLHSNKPPLKKMERMGLMEWENIEWMLDHFDWSSFSKTDVLDKFKTQVDVTVKLALQFGMNLSDVYDDFKYVKSEAEVDLIHTHFPEWLKRDVSRAKFNDAEVYEHCLKLGSFAERPTIPCGLDLTKYMTPARIDHCVYKYLKKHNVLTRWKREWLLKQLFQRHSEPHSDFNVILKYYTDNIKVLKQMVPLLKWNQMDKMDKHAIVKQLNSYNIGCFCDHLHDLLYAAIRTNKNVDLIAYKCRELNQIQKMSQSYLDSHFDGLNECHKIALCHVFPDLCMGYDDPDVAVLTHFLKKRKLK